MYLVLRESVPRQVDKKSGCPQGEKGLDSQGGGKGKLFFSLQSLCLYKKCILLEDSLWKKTFWLILLS